MADGIPAVALSLLPQSILYHPPTPISCPHLTASNEGDPDPGLTLKAALSSSPGIRPLAGLAHFPQDVETQSDELPPPVTQSGSSWALLWGFCLLVQRPVLKGHVTCLPPCHRPAGESGIDSLIMRSHCHRSARGCTPAAPLLWGFSGF